MHSQPPTTSSAQPVGDKKLPCLQALRGVAALMVVFFHMAPHWEVVPALQGLTGSMHFGFAGVDVFFILSGFVVYWSAQSAVARIGLRAFIQRRALRIYLGYWPVLLVVAMGSAWAFQTALPSWKTMLGSFFLLYPSLFDNWLPTAWSLTYELYFYAWISCIVGLPLRFQRCAIVGSIAVLTLWNTGWLVLQPQTVYAGVQPLRFLLTGYGIEFLLGALVADLYRQHRQHWPRAATMLPLCLSLACLGLALGTTSPYFDRVEVMRAGSFGLFALGVFLATLSLQTQGFKAPRWLVLVGDASFSLYLLHPYLLALAGKIRVGPLQGSGPGILLFSLLLPVLFVGISVLWFKAVEYPLMRRLLYPAARPTGSEVLARVP